MSLNPGRRRRGIVLPLVLIIGLLLTTAIVSFVRRSVIDRMIVLNRDRAAQAEALARGGIRIGIGVLFQYRVDYLLQKLGTRTAPGVSLQDLWARIGDTTLTTPEGAQLRITIRDAGARLNLNALVPVAEEGAESQPPAEAEEFLVAVLEKVIDEMDPPPAEGHYQPREMARNLLDYMDLDDTGIGGQREDDYYQSQDPPYRAANRPLLSLGEVALVQGFDARFAEALEPYADVYPLVQGAGINLNTAPPHVLALTYHGSGADMRLAGEDEVRQILEARENESLLCSQTEKAPDRCVTLSTVGLGEGGVFPEADLPAESGVFTLLAEATVGDVVRSIEVAVDATEIRELRLLSWSLRR